MLSLAIRDPLARSPRLGQPTSVGSTSESARPATRPGRPYDPRRLATVWREGRGVLLGALLLGIGLGVGAALAYPRQWTAETWLERQPVDGVCPLTMAAVLVA